MPRVIRSSESPFAPDVVPPRPDSVVSRPNTRGKHGNWVEPFLSAIKGGYSVVDAAAIAKIHPTLPYKTRETNEEFRQAWKEAAVIGTDLLEEEAHRRAYHGTDRPVFFKGTLCGTYKEYDNKLLMDLLRVRRPEVYGRVEDDDRGRNVTVNINVGVVSDRSDLGGSTAPVIDVEVVGGGEDRQQISPALPEAAPVPD